MDKLSNLVTSLKESDTKTKIIGAVIVTGITGFFLLYRKTTKQEEIPKFPSSHSFQSRKIFCDYPDSIKDNWYQAIKFLKAYPLYYSLPQKNKIYYNEFGDSTGFPIIHFHGSGGSHFEGLLYDKIARKYGFRYIAIDRPGQGRTTIPNKKYTLKSFGKDLSMFLINELKIDKNSDIGVCGGSQGGLFAIGLLNVLKQEGFNVKICIVLGGLPLTNFGKYMRNELDPRYYQVIPKGIQDQVKLYWDHPWIYKAFNVLFLWYMNRQNEKNKHTKNYNYAIEFIREQNLLTDDDYKRSTRHVSGMVDEKGEELNGLWMSKVGSAYAYGFNGMQGERWCSEIQKEEFDFKDVGRDVLILWYHGKEDRIIPCEWVKLYHELEFNGLRLKAQYLDGIGHMIFMFDDIERALKDAKEVVGN